MNRENDELHLRSLPRERASDFFTARVMARVREIELKPRRRSAAIVATSAAGAVLLALAVGFLVDTGPSAPPETASLAVTDDVPVSALESIEAGDTQFEPVIYVGSTDHYDFYLDLRPSETTAGGIHPASYSGALQPGL
jgi:hypothetical protein